LQDSSFVNSNLNFVNFQTTTGLTCDQIQQAKSARLVELPYYLRQCELPPLDSTKVSKLDKDDDSGQKNTRSKKSTKRKSSKK